MDDRRCAQLWHSLKATDTAAEMNKSALWGKLLRKWIKVQKRCSWLAAPKRIYIGYDTEEWMIYCWKNKKQAILLWCHWYKCLSCKSLWWQICQMLCLPILYLLYSAYVDHSGVHFAVQQNDWFNTSTYLLYLYTYTPIYVYHHPLHVQYPGRFTDLVTMEKEHNILECVIQNLQMYMTHTHRIKIG